MSLFRRWLRQLRSISSASSRKSRTPKLQFDTLDARIAPAADLLSTVDINGNLTVADSDAIGVDNLFAATIVGADLVISDGNATFSAAPSGWTLASDSKSISIPVANFSGQITIQGELGNDTLTVDLSSGMLPNIVFDGGAGGDDTLVVIGDGSTTAAYSPASGSTATNKQGTVQVVGSGTTNISFSNLEPVNIKPMPFSRFIPNALFNSIATFTQILLDLPGPTVDLKPL